MGLTLWLAFGKGDTIGGAKGGTGADFDTGGGGGAEGAAVGVAPCS